MPPALLEPVDRGDVRMVQRGEHLRLAPKTGDPLRIVGESLGQDFERDVATEVAVAGAIHLAHAACADGSADFVGADPGTSTQGQARGLYALSPNDYLRCCVDVGPLGSRDRLLIQSFR